MVRNWLSKEEVFKKTKSGHLKKQIHPPAKGMYEELDAAVAEFLNNERAVGQSVSNKQLMEKAKELALILNVPSQFKASCMWLKGWKIRNNVSLRRATNDSQKIPEDYYDVLQGFRSEIVRLHNLHKYRPSDVFNMDQTMCRFDMAPNRTNDTIGSKSIRIMTTKATKKGFTVALAANGAGEKLPALIVFKEKGGKLGPRVSQSLEYPPNVKVMASTNGWMTENIYHAWLHTIYGSDMAVRRLLIVDHYKPHMTENSVSIVAGCNSDLLFVPAGCTPLVQPMDVSINRPFKQAMRELWVKWFSEHTSRTIHGNLKQPTRQDAINWVSTAWDSIKLETIVDSFLCCGITAAVDGSDDTKMFSHVPRVITVSEDESEAEQDDSDDATDDSDAGDDFEGFGAEDDPFEQD